MKYCNFFMYGGGFLNTSASGNLFKSNKKYKNYPVSVDLKIFEDNHMIFDKNKFCEFNDDNGFELSESKFKILTKQEESNNKLFLFKCSIDTDDDGYFSMDSQVTYENKEKQKFASVLYDTIPLTNERSLKSPFLMLNHKVWLSNKVNTFIVLMNYFDDNKNIGKNEFDINVFDQKGDLIKTLKVKNFKYSKYIDLKYELQDVMDFREELNFLTVVAKGLFSPTVILTFTKNMETGNMSVEHSLPPYYYVRGNIPEIRKTSINF